MHRQEWGNRKSRLRHAEGRSWSRLGLARDHSFQGLRTEVRGERDPQHGVKAVVESAEAIGNRFVRTAFVHPAPPSVAESPSLQRRKLYLRLELVEDLQNPLKHFFFILR